MTTAQVSPPPAAREAGAPLDVHPAIVATVARARAAFDRGVTRPIEWRLEQLRQLERMVLENEARFVAALASDLGKPSFESWAAETNYIVDDARYIARHLRSWAAPKRVASALFVQPARSRIEHDPLGVVLVIAPWNYPMQLSLSPLAGAIAGGNAVVLKPSEVSPASSALLAELVPKYLDREAVHVVEGAVAETTTLLAERFDHIFYTGNGAVARVVMTAAAKHLTPMTLELGGKSPTIVLRDADLDVAARRIAWGKFFNAGQTCVAPDYVLVDASVEEPLVERLRACITAFYGADPKASPDFGRIVSQRHLKRLVGLLSAGDVVVGGTYDTETRYLAPTLLRDVPLDAPVMCEEIFGPILPIVPIDGLDAAIAFVRERPKPLALYVFTGSRSAADEVLARTSSGGACVNDVVSHLVPHDLPFGGVGPSGMGAYHGRHSFETFTHRKSVLDKPTFIDPPVRYPPYSEATLKWLKRLM